MNQHAGFKNKFIRISAITFMIIALILVLFLGVFDVRNVAYSVSPEKYESDVENTPKTDGSRKDWYMGEDYLDLDRLKTTVNAWRVSNAYNFDGIEPVIVAVIDSGINASHPLFSGKYDENGAPVDTDDVGEYDVLLRDAGGNLIEISTAGTASNFNDVASNYHGTHVAGIIATFIHELNLEKYIKILPIRAGTRSSGGANFNYIDMDEAIQKALEYGANVVNMSITHPEPNKTLYNVVKQSYAQKAVFVAAAGNNGLEGKYYPAAGKYCIGVMNYSKSSMYGKILSGTSNYGSDFELCAPGNEYYSADGATSDGYTALSGTSMATPVVSFGAALRLLKSRAYANARSERDELSPSELHDEVVSATYVNGVYASKKGKYYPAFDINRLVADTPEMQIELASDSLGAFEQYINDVKPVKMRFVMDSPVYDVNDGTIEWYEVDDKGKLSDKIGQGESIEYVLKNEICTKKVVAKWSFTQKGVTYSECTKAVELKVKYIELTVDEVQNIVLGANDTDGNAVVNSKVQVGKEYEFYLSNVQTSALSDDTLIYWFVNGKLAGEGKTFRYTFDKEENTVISVRINNQFGNAFIADFSKEQDNDKDVAMSSLKTETIIAICISCGVVALLIAYLIVRNNNIDKIR